MPVAAKIIFTKPCDYDTRGAKAIAEWLRRAAKDVERFHKDMSKKCVYRYQYVTEEK